MGDNTSQGVFRGFYIPDYLLVPGSKPEKFTHVPACPVIVFINSKSGGQLGGQLLVTYRSLLNKNQVFDLGASAPDKILHRLFVTLEVLKSNGDHFADQVEKKLRIIVAGGDGTASWLLGVVSDLKLPKPLPVATVPLGTGNNLPFSFGWGKKNPGTDKQSVQMFLDQVKAGKEMKVDSWHLVMRMKTPKGGSCEPIAPLELPHSLHAVHRVSKSDALNMASLCIPRLNRHTCFSFCKQEGNDTFRGGFWNYFSMGMDSQVSYAFHSERKLHPEKFRNQLSNQSTYLKLGCTQGWFCASLMHASSRNIAQLTKVKIMRRHGKWEDLLIPHFIRSIVCLNLPSFSGGLNPWGRPNPNKRRERDLTPPYVDDGLIEIVGFRNAWHGIALLSPNGHGTRLAQTNRVRFEFHKGAADHTYMRIDGEPWKQPLPVGDDTVMIEISHGGQVTMLATAQCRSRSVHDSMSPVSYSNDSDNSSEEEDSVDDWEDKKKFGAANTFKIPEGVDISHLS